MVVALRPRVLVPLFGVLVTVFDRCFVDDKVALMEVFFAGVVRGVILDSLALTLRSRVDPLTLQSIFSFPLLPLPFDGVLLK